MKITFERIVKFHNIGSRRQEELTKLGYALKKKIKQTAKILQPMMDLEASIMDEQEDIKRDCAFVDEKTKTFIYDIIKDAQGNDVQMYKYTIEKKAERDKKLRKLRDESRKKINELLETETEIEPYIINVADIPTNLTSEEIDAYRGIVIPEDYEPK